MPAASTTAYLLIDVAGITTAVAVTAIREILPLPHLHAPPSAGGLLAGFMNLSGAAIPVIDLAQFLGLRSRSEPDPYRHILLFADGSTALLVDRVLDMVTVEARSIRPIEDTRTLNGCVEAEVAVGDRLIHVLSLPRLLTWEEKIRIGDHARRTAERLALLAPV